MKTQFLAKIGRAAVAVGLFMIGLAPSAWAETYDYAIVLENGVAYKNSTSGDVITSTVAGMGLTYAGGVWTMNNFRFTTTQGKALTFRDTDVTLVVSGSNCITNGAGKWTSYALNGLHNVAIKGATAGVNTLTLKAQDAANVDTGMSCGAYVEEGLSIGDNVTVTAIGGAGQLSSTGVFADSILVSGTGKLIAQADATSSNVRTTGTLVEPDADAKNTDTGTSPTWDNGPGTYFNGSDRATNITLTKKTVLPVQIPSAPTALEGTTHKVYTNGVESADGTVWSNGTATVVYTAKEGYVFSFKDRSTVLTNALNTSVNPAVNKTEPTVIKVVKLSDADIVDAETGVTNATATVCVDDTEVTANPDGTYTIPGGAPIKITYTVTENAVLGYCLKEKDLWLKDGVTDDRAVTAEEKAPILAALSPAWIAGDEGREIALDTRTRLVIAAPTNVLPIAYSTNFWATTEDWASCDRVQVKVNGPSAVMKEIVQTVENGYAEWFPEEGAYGKYTLTHSTRGAVSHDVSADIYYTSEFPVSWTQTDHGTLAVTRDGATLVSPASVLGYSLLQLAATPVYSNAERYEFARWTVMTNGVAYTNIAETAATLEMPNAAVQLAGAFQWKSNYAEAVSVKAGEEWQIRAGEQYAAGITAESGAVVSFRDRICPCSGQGSQLNLAAGTTNVWDFTENGSPYFTSFTRINAAEGAVNMILFDGTLENKRYAIASIASAAKGQTFLISDGSSTAEATVVEQAALETADWVYVGAKRFQIYVMANGVLILTVEDGRFTITYDAAGGAWSDGAETSNLVAYVMTGYAFPAENPTRSGYAFLGWYRGPEEDAERVDEADVTASPITPYAAHALSAHWKSCLQFEKTQFAVAEGETAKVLVWGGSPDNAVQATVTWQKNTSNYSVPYVNGKLVSFPLTLTWAKGDVSAREIEIRTTATKRTEQDSFFTLQLGSAVGEAFLDGYDVCTVTVLDAQTGIATNYVRALAWPAHGGTVSGGGTLANAKASRTLSATPKNGALFAGWFRAKTDNAEVIDLDAPVEPYNARSPRQIRVGYDAKEKRIVNAAGTYFAYFTNVLEVAAVVEPCPFDEEGRAAAGVAGVTAWNGNGVYSTMVGVKFALPVAFTDGSGKGRLSVSKLPSGLSYNAKKGQIAGVPTKAGTYNAQFTASNAAGSHKLTYTFEVAAIPALAVGTFAGVVTDDPSRTGVGAVSFTAGKTGSLSAKVTRRLSGARSFSVKGYDYIDANTFGIAMTNTAGEVFEATLALTNGWYDTTVVGRAFAGTKKGSLALNGEADGTFAATRNAFATADKNADAQQILATFTGSYAQTLASATDAATVGSVQIRVKPQGSVYVAARLDKTADGAKTVAAQSFSGTVAGGFVYDAQNARGTSALALRSGTGLWSTAVIFDAANRDIAGWARVIRPNAEDAAQVVDADETVGPAPAE